MIKRKEQTSPKDKYKCITCILNKMKLATEHTKTEKKDVEKRSKEKTPGDLGPGDTTAHMRDGGFTVQLCGDKSGVQMDQWRTCTRDKMQRYHWEFKESCTGREELPHRSLTSTTS